MPNAPKRFSQNGKQSAPRKPWQSNGPDRRKGLRGRKAQETKKRILERDGYQCQDIQCGALVQGTKDSILDHVTPLSQGGTHDDSNLQILCLDCSRRKTQRESQEGRK